MDQTYDRTTTLTPVLTRSPSGAVPSLVRRPRASRWKAFSWLMLAAAGVGASVAFEPWKSVASRSVQAASHGPESQQEVLKSVAVERPARASTASVVLPATFRPWQTTTLHARVSGYLAAWHRELGTTVKAGELLAEIETPELDQELVEAKALVREANAAAAQAKAERAEAEADLSVADAQLVRIQASLKLTMIQLKRREILLPSRAIPQEEYDTYATQLETQTAEIAAAKADIARRKSNLETRAAIIDAREATAKSRQANVDRLEELQTFKRIVAPFDGVVTNRSAEVGMLVTAGKESLFTVDDMSRIRVQINVPQTYALQTSPGVAALVSVPESSVKGIAGTITRISKVVEANNRTMLAEIELANEGHRLQPGSYAQVTLTTPQDMSDWTIPTNTVAMRVDGTHVAAVNANNEVQFKRVTLGRDLGNRVVVVDGIQGTERLIVNPGDDLSDGARIQVRDKVGNAVAKR